MHGYWIFAVAVFFGSLELIALYLEQRARSAWMNQHRLAAPASGF